MRTYTVITPLAVPGRRDPLPPGCTVDMDETAGRKLVSRGVLAEAADTAAAPSAGDGQLATVQAALDGQIAATQVAEAQRDAAEARAQQAEAELAALRAQAAPPPEKTPPEEPPTKEPPIKEQPPAPEAKKTARAK